MIEFIVNGTPYKDFIACDVTVAMDTLANDFAFTSSSVGGFPPFKINDTVIALIDGEQIITGYIDEITGINTEGRYDITYSGRDRTSDLIDSEINQIADIRAESLTLKSLIERVIDDIGSDLSVIDSVSPAPFNLAEDFVSPRPGENALAFIMRYVRKRQVLLSSDPDGNVLITKPSTIYNGDVVQSVFNEDTNNVISENWNFISSAMHSSYIHRGQFDLRALNFSGDTDIAAVENQSAEVIYSGARNGRQRVVIDKGYSSQQLRERAKWTRQLAISRAIRYVCAVPGHTKPQGGVWAENELIQVNSSAANINRIMHVNSARFTQADGRPSITTLEFVERGVYSADDAVINKRYAGELGDAFGSMG